MKAWMRHLVLLAIICLGAGCGDDDGGGSRAAAGGGTATPTATPDSHGHEEIHVGATAAVGGALALDPEANTTIEVPFDQCLGGSGEACTGGTRLFLASSPGFESLEESEPEEGLYALAEGSVLRLVLVSAPPGVSLKFENTRLDQTGETAVLGSVPFHADVEWQVAVADGESVPHHVNVVVRLTSLDGAYAASPDLTLRLEPVADEDHEEDDHEEDDHEEDDHEDGEDGEDAEDD